MGAVEHFAHYLTTVSRARLEELTTISFTWNQYLGLRRHIIAEMVTEHAQAMVYHEINTRAANVKYPLDRPA